MKKHGAAISIFLIIITLSSVMLGGLFIDMTRILVAKNKVRTAAESAVRSTLAGYSEKMASDWGLFGLLKDDAEDDFKKYLKLNLITDSSDSGANIIHYEIVDDETSITLSKPLSNNTVFTEKITEYEKYRAPVSLTMGVIDKFKAAFGDSNDVSKLQATGLIDSLESKISNTYTNIKNQVSTTFSSIVNGSGVTTDTSASGGQMNTVDTSKFSNLRNNVNSDIENSKDAVDSYSASLKEYEDAGDTADSQASEIKNSVNTNGANGSITDDDTETVDEGINTYSNTPETNDGLDSVITNESSILSDTEKQAAESSAKTEDLKAKMESLIADAEKKAEEYNRLAAVYNQYYAEISSIAASAGSGITAGDLLAYDTDEKRNKAKKDVQDLNKKITEAESEITSLETEIKSKTGSSSDSLDSAITSAKNKDDAMRTEYNNITNKINNKTLEDDDEIKAEIRNNKSTYKYLYAYLSEYFSDTDHEDDSMSDFIKSFYNDEISEANDDLKTLRDYKSKLETKQSSLKSLYAQKLEKDYLVKVAVMNNSEKIKKTLAAKEEAQNYYNNTYKPALDAISEVNTQEEIGVDNIDDYSVKAVENVSGVEEDDSFSISELTKFGEEVKKIVEDWNKTLPTAGSQESDLQEESGMIKMFGKLRDYFVGIGELFTNKDKLIDKVYLVDYIMSKCTFVTSQTDRKHYFSRGEAEYIIFGFSSQGANIAASVGSIAFMRFAINTINYFLTSADGELISRAVISVARGLKQSAEDMTVMLFDYGDKTGTEKGLIAICPSLSSYKVLSYSDHLRILLLLKIGDDGGAGALRRCMHATMKEKYGDNIASVTSTSDYLGEYYTQAAATAAVDVDLFFIPMFMPDSASFASVNDGKYRITATVTYGY